MSRCFRFAGFIIGIVMITMCLFGACAEEERDAILMKTGDTISFGHYEQDGNEENGPEEIEWIVLAEKDGKRLLVSRYALDAIPYHTTDSNITWEKSSLRSWLNDEFLKNAFTEDEKGLIFETEVDNSQKQGFDRWNNWKNTKGGNNTKDRVFLLSYLEAEKYLGVSWNSEEDNPLGAAEMTEALRQKTSDYRFYRNIPEDDPEYGLCTWWLRSPGYTQDLIAVVNRLGLLIATKCNHEYTGVRPAIWINSNVQ